MQQGASEEILIFRTQNTVMATNTSVHNISRNKIMKLCLRGRNSAYDTSLSGWRHDLGVEPLPRVLLEGLEAWSSGSLSLDSPSERLGTWSGGQVGAFH